jgi:hypothetical protein
MPSPDAYREKSPAEYVAETERRKQEETLRHLVESGRAESREAAEQYLNTINQIKEKLIQFARNRVTAKPGTTISHSERSFIQYRDAEATPADLDKITVDDLDRANPGLWKLERHVDSSYTQLRPEYRDDLGDNEISTRDRLQLALANHAAVEIYPDWVHRGAVTFRELQQYLTEEDFAFMVKEYSFTAKDLAKVLQAAADRVASHTGPADAWERFSSRERK